LLGLAAAALPQPAGLLGYANATGGGGGAGVPPLVGGSLVILLSLLNRL
jgi:hypothetical protein